MRLKMATLRTLISSTALSLALSLVCLAQQAAGSQQQEQYPASRIEGLVREWTRARDYTKEYLDAMPEEHIGFKPTPEIRSFAEQMLHLANGNFGIGSRLLGTTNPHQGKNLEQISEFKATKAALTRIVTESYDYVISGLKGLNDAKLDETVQIFGNNRPRIVAIGLMFEHQTHHRGQTTIYIRLKGIKPPNERLF